MKAHLHFMEILTSLHFVIHHIDLPSSSIHLIRMIVFYIQFASKIIEQDNAKTDIPCAILLETAVQVYMNLLMNNLIFGHSSNKKYTPKCHHTEHVTLSYSKIHLRRFTQNGDICVNSIVLCSVKTGMVLLYSFQTPKQCLTHKSLLIKICSK